MTWAVQLPNDSLPKGVVMRKLPFILLLASGFSLSACDDASVALLEKSEPNTLQFSLFSTAWQARLQLEASGAEVSGITFLAGMWTFTSSAPLDDEFTPVLAAGDCVTTGTSQAGTTACDLFSDAQREHDAMKEAGYEVTPVTFNSRTGKWEFDWRVPLNPN